MGERLRDEVVIGPATTVSSRRSRSRCPATGGAGGPGGSPQLGAVTGLRGGEARGRVQDVGSLIKDYETEEVVT